VTDREAHDLVRAIEHLWHLDMGADGRTTWCNSLIQFDNVIASEAILKLSERQRERPTVADVRGMIAKIKREEGRSHSPPNTLAASPASEKTANTKATPERHPTTRHTAAGADNGRKASRAPSNALCALTGPA
jgi:hypothetical protein